jgi:hypothetical protein
MDSKPPQELPRRPDIERRRKIKEGISKLSRLPLAILDEYMEDVVVRSDYLIKKYPNAKQYAVYHDLVSSSIGPDPEAKYPGIIYTDFLEDDSIEKFVEDLLKKYHLN